MAFWNALVDVVHPGLVSVVDVLLHRIFDVAEPLLARQIELLLVEKAVDGVIVRAELALTVEQQRIAGQRIRVGVRIECVRRTDGIDGGHVRFSFVGC